MTHHTIGRSLAAAALALGLQGTQASITATFESIPLGGAESFWNGSDGSGGFNDGAHFNNTYNASFGSWSGFAVSNTTDTTTPGFGNQYSAYTGGGAGGSSQYAVGYVPNPIFSSDPNPTISFGKVTNLNGYTAEITNTTYAALSMLNGDSFSKQFGGVTGDDPDFFLLTITGYNGATAGNSVDFYLADYRFADNSQDYIVDEWTSVDLSAIGSADSLQFSLTSSDVGGSGINTPTYFALDNIVVPEPSALLCSLAGLGLLARRRR